MLEKKRIVIRNEHGKLGFSVPKDISEEDLQRKLELAEEILEWADKHHADVKNMNCYS